MTPPRHARARCPGPLALLGLGAGCALVAGGRYRDEWQKLSKQIPGTNAAPPCSPAASGAACKVLFPAKDVSDIVTLARDVGGLDPRRAGPAPEDRVYYDLIVDNAPVVDLARHGPEGLYPGVPFLFDLGSLALDAAGKVEKARLALHVVKEGQVGEVTWRLGRLRRGVVAGRQDIDGARAGEHEPPVLPAADFGRDPGKMFDGLKFLAFTGKPFDGKTYREQLEEGMLDSKVGAAQRDRDVVSFDVTAAVRQAQEDKLAAIVLLLTPAVARAAKASEASYLFVATRAAPESIRPALTVEYQPAPPPEDVEAADKLDKTAGKKKHKQPKK